MDDDIRLELNRIKKDIKDLKCCERAKQLIRDFVYCPKCKKKATQNLTHTAQYRCDNPNCSVLEFVDDELEPRITVDEQDWLQE